MRFFCIKILSLYVFYFFSETQQIENLTKIENTMEVTEELMSEVDRALNTNISAVNRQLGKINGTRALIKCGPFCQINKINKFVVKHAPLSMVPEIVNTIIKRRPTRGLIRVLQREYRGVVKKAFDIYDIFPTCNVCKGIMTLVRAAMWSSFIGDKVKSLIVTIASKLSWFTSYDSTFIQGVVNLNWPILRFVLKNSNSEKDVSPGVVCQIIAQPACIGIIRTRQVRSIPTHRTLTPPCELERRFDGSNKTGEDFSGDCLEEATGNVTIETVTNVNLAIERRKKNNLIKIIHLGDVHVDSYYAPGSSTQCKRVMCCNYERDIQQGGGRKAGRWGEYEKCDPPEELIENAISHIAQKHPDAKLLYYTGDTVAHNIWDTNKYQIRDSIGYLANLFDKYFRKKGIQIFNIFGNHDNHPLNVFAPNTAKKWYPPEINNTDTYAMAAEKWRMFFRKGEHADMIKHMGYYAVENVLNDKLKIIALNNNVCYGFNWWLLFTDMDWLSQLKWLENELNEAQRKKQVVHVLAHIPPGYGYCYVRWQKFYRYLIYKFSDIIKAEFNGHTHGAHIKLLRENSKVYGVAFDGASLTPWEGNDPSYRVYYADPKTFEILDFDEWSFSLPRANIFEPKWRKLYSFKKAYGLRSMTFKDLNTFVEKLSKDEELLGKYVRNIYKQSKWAKKNIDHTDKKVLRTELCDIVKYKVDESCQNLDKNYL